MIMCHSVSNVWLETTLLPVWPRDARKLNALCGCPRELWGEGAGMGVGGDRRWWPERESESVCFALSACILAGHAHHHPQGAVIIPTPCRGNGGPEAVPKATQLNNSGTRSELRTRTRLQTPHPHCFSVFLEAGLLSISLPPPLAGIRPPSIAAPQLQTWAEAMPPVPREGGMHPLLSGTLDSLETSGILAHEGILGATSVLTHVGYFPQNVF